MGGLTLGDEVGLDVTAKVVKNLMGPQPKFLGERMEGGDLSILDDMVAAGFLGKKAGKGWFDHTGGGKEKKLNAEALKLNEKYKHPTKDLSKTPIDEVFERCFLRFLKETIHCLEDGIVATARDGDIGAVFGIGFPPFLGGPFMYAARARAAPPQTPCPLPSFLCLLLCPAAGAASLHAMTRSFYGSLSL